MAILCVHNPSSLLVQGGAIWVGSGVNVLTISSSKIYSNIAGRGVSADPRETACTFHRPLKFLCVHHPSALLFQGAIHIYGTSTVVTISLSSIYSNTANYLVRRTNFEFRDRYVTFP